MLIVAVAASALGSAVAMPRADVQAFSSSSVSAMYTAGSVSVAQPGVPGALSFCAATSWSYTSSDMPAFMATVNLQGTFFVWNVEMDMTAAGCENANGGAGSITGGTISGVSPGGGTLSCGFTGGSYTRTGVIIDASVDTTCSTNGVAAPITFDLAAAWVPDVADLQGVLGPITDATMAGALTSTPS